MDLPSRIEITEVGPRDGLQNEPENVPIEDKVQFINLLSAAGFREIEATSFVSPKWVPQLGDADQVMARIDRKRDVIYSVLAPNTIGLDNALVAGADKIAVFTAASETFTQKNTNTSIDQSIQRFEPMVQTARDAGCPVRGYVSCAVACPYEGRIDPAQVRDIVQRLKDIGVTEIDLGETIGVAAPSDMDRLFDAVGTVVPIEEIVLHLHDTRGTALACAYRAMQLGVRCFDASCGGLGGCPFAPGAAGNLATEDLVYMAHGMNIESGVSLERLIAAGRYISDSLGRRLPGRVLNAELATRNTACSADA